MNKVKLAFLAIGVSFAIALTFSCSSGGGGGGEDNNNPDVDVDTKGKSVDEILASGTDALKNEQWDEAVAYYNAAYAKDNNDPKAVIYSVLANLAKISTDPKVVALIKDNFGFTEYPNKLNALFSDSWMKKYPDYDIYDSVFLPAIKTPDWVKGEGSVYNDALLSGNVFGSDAWAISLLANLLDKNASGLNNTLDEVIDGVFGGSFNEAVNRLKKLENKKEDRISLDPYFIDELGLEDAFDEYDKIGWAEVNAVVSAMLLVKASLEWLQTYDLNTDLNWLKHPWKDEDTFIAKFNTVSASNLPFINNFFKERKGKNMNQVKADYVAAIQGFQKSYESIINSDLYPSKVKESYATINGGFEQLIAAINGGGKFYIPENPTEGTWPTSKTGDVFGTIDFGKFFTPGYFALNNIFETNGGKPAFYKGYEVETITQEEECYSGWNGGEEVCYTYTYYNYDWNYEPLSDPADLDDSNLCLKLNTSYITGIVDSDDIDDELYIPILGGELAKAVFAKYYP
jgi:hypothetical protein